MTKRLEQAKGMVKSATRTKNAIRFLQDVFWLDDDALLLTVRGDNADDEDLQAVSDARLLVNNVLSHTRLAKAYKCRNNRAKESD
jgi:glycine betaine/choline ABC-type transport system substrate-binding protein